MIGTLVNCLTVITGSIIGVNVHSNIPDNLQKILFQGIGLFTLALGVSMFLKSEYILIVITSIVVGSLCGELLQLESQIEKLGDFLKNQFDSSNERFTEGMMTAFLLFCMGSMTILGAFEEGLQGKPNLLFAKSLMDGVSSIALAATFGYGVIFSVIPLLLYQGGLTLLAGSLKGIMTEPVINEMVATGGILLLGLSLDILDLKKIKTLNMLPAIILAVLLAIIFI